ncbi:MAG: 50S ribosomal protein L29 [Armatimonadetes bacterium]|nr:50S ribosomal protein L29 [Armatimonadota bacterium]
MKQTEFVNKVAQASNTELESLLEQERASLYTRRQEIARKQLSNPQAIGIARKNVARVLSEMRAREIKAGRES